MSLPASTSPFLGRPSISGSFTRPVAQDQTLVDALNRVLEAKPAESRDPVRRLFDESTALLGGGHDVQVLRFTGIRAEGIKVAQQAWSAGVAYAASDAATADSPATFATKALNRIVPVAPADLGEPRMVTLGTDFPDIDRDGFARHCRDRYLRPNDWSEVMIGAWRSGPDTVLSTLTYAREQEDRKSPAFSSRQERLASVATRAAGPLLDPHWIEDLDTVASPSVARGDSLGGADRAAAARDRRDLQATATPIRQTPLTPPTPTAEAATDATESAAVPVPPRVARR